jgi:hypothetical protein
MTQMDENLIFDVGMHKDEDADFYLKKGFPVIGVEANPEPARSVRAALPESVPIRPPDHRQ